MAKYKREKTGERRARDNGREVRGITVGDERKDGRWRV